MDGNAKGDSKGIRLLSYDDFVVLLFLEGLGVFEFFLFPELIKHFLFVYEIVNHVEVDSGVLFFGDHPQN